MKLGILGTSDIAFRRFLPALETIPDLAYAGVASRTPEKGRKFVETFGGAVYPSYDVLLADESIDAVYVPLPPALHYEWGKKVLKSGKHLLMEKPFTTSLKDTEKLLALAKSKGLAVHENYMFLYHGQLAKIKELIADGSLGDIRLYRMAFGFPKRGGDDFRYKKELGGGALLDCGGYPVRLALELLGESAEVVQAKLSQPEGYEVDLFGSAVVQNDAGLCAQVSFGMHNAYKCELEIWGSQGALLTGRIFTAPPGFYTSAVMWKDNREQTIALTQDDAFRHSVLCFLDLCRGAADRQTANAKILRQSELIDDIRRYPIRGKA